MLCALRVTNIGFVQCLHLGFPFNFALVCFYVLRASPRKHRVCAVLFPQPLLSLYACVFFFQLFCYAYFASQTSGLCSAFLSVPFLKVCALMFLTFCYVYFPSQTSGLCSAFPLPPVKFVRLSLSCYVMRTSPHKHQFLAVLFSWLPFKFTRLYWSCFVKTVKFVSAFLKHLETL